MSRKEVTRETIGHNERAARAATAYHLSGLMKAKGKKESSDGEYSSFLSRLQAKGLDLDAAKEALKIKKSGKVAEQVEYLRKLAFYLEILGCPLESDQPDLFVKPANAMMPEERASEHGFGAGILGENMDANPHSVETDLGQAWVKAWHEGVKARQKVAQEEAAEEEADASEEAGDGERADIEDEA